MAPLSENRSSKDAGPRAERYLPAAAPPHGEEVLLQVDGLHDEALLQDISLRLRKGEILGIAGLAGAAKPSCAKRCSAPAKAGCSVAS